MATIFWITSMLALNLNLGEVDRMPSWYATLDEPSEEVHQDSTQFKLVMRQDSIAVSYKLDDDIDGSWNHLWTSDGRGSQGGKVFTLPAGNYRFKCEKSGYNSVTTYQVMRGGHYMEIVASLYKPRREELQMKKPAIYLYSPTPVEVNLQVKPSGRFTFCYPEYEERLAGKRWSQWPIVRQ